MKIISKDANPSGSYFSPQDWPDSVEIPGGRAVWPSTLDSADFYTHNGFVILHVEQMEGIDTVASYEPNTEAWEDWKASLPPNPEPEPEPTLEERVAGIEAAVQEGLRLYEGDLSNG